MLGMARFAFRTHRFEVATVLLACLVLTVSALIVTLHLDAASAAVPAGCFHAWFFGSTGWPAGCEAPAETFFDLTSGEASLVMGAMAILPFAVGLLLGPPLVARELEARTVETAWTLAGSRTRWLVTLAFPVAVTLLVAVGVTAVASGLLAAAREPWLPAPGWQDIGLFGPIVVARSLAIFAAGLLIGAVAGRTVPALTLTLIAGALIVTGAWFVRGEWQTANRELIDVRNGYDPGSFTWGQRMLVDESGTPISYEQAVALAPDGLSAEAADLWTITNLRSVEWGVRADRLPEWEAIESAGLTGFAVALCAMSMVVVERRRPR